MFQNMLIFRDTFKILYPVIVRYSINMMDDMIIRYLTTPMLFPDHPMLIMFLILT